MEPISISVLIVLAVVAFIAGALGGLLLTGGFQGVIIGIVFAIIGFITLCIIAPKAIERIMDVINKRRQ
jgi:hypothetical protein